MHPSASSGIGKMLIPLGVAAAVQWFQNSNTPAPQIQPQQNFNFVSQPNPSTFSKVLSFFGSGSTTQLASPDIPKLNQNIPFQQPLNPETQFQQLARNPSEFLPRRTSVVPGVGVVPDQAGRIVGARALLSENVAEQATPNRNEVSQSFVQSVPTKIPVHSFIGDALKPVDGGLFSEVASKLGLEDPKLDQMSKILLNNVDNLVHIKNRDQQPILLGMKYESGMSGEGGAFDLPEQRPKPTVTYNVFDDKTSPALKKAIREQATFRPPEVRGVAFNDF